jgi:hypothetical protein
VLLALPAAARARERTGYLRIAIVAAVALQAIGAIAGAVAILLRCWTHIYGNVGGRVSSMGDGIATRKKGGISGRGE